MGTEELKDHQKWEIDEVIMKYWDAKTKSKKRKIELECYKLFKNMNFNDGFIAYLNNNEAGDLGDEMDHFSDIYHKVPHEHEKRKAA